MMDVVEKKKRTKQVVAVEFHFDGLQLQWAQQG